MPAAGHGGGRARRLRGRCRLLRRGRRRRCVGRRWLLHGRLLCRGLVTLLPWCRLVDGLLLRLVRLRLSRGLIGLLRRRRLVRGRGGLIRAGSAALGCGEPGRRHLLGVPLRIVELHRDQLVLDRHQRRLHAHRKAAVHLHGRGPLAHERQVVAGVFPGRRRRDLADHHHARLHLQHEHVQPRVDGIGAAALDADLLADGANQPGAVERHGLRGGHLVHGGQERRNLRYLGRLRGDRPRGGGQQQYCQQACHGSGHRPEAATSNAATSAAVALSRRGPA